MDLPGLAVVGMGGFARVHLEYVQRAEAAGIGRHVAQVAIPADYELYGAEIEELELRGVRIFSSLREMLAVARDRIDVTCIPTGIPLHRPMTVAALEAGTSVLMEKPAAGSIQDVHAMIDAAHRSGLLCAVGYQHLYRADVQHVKELVCSGKLGKLTRVKSRGCWPRGPDYYGRNSWAGRLALDDQWVLDSPHNNAFAHLVNSMCYLGCDQPGRSLSPRSVVAEMYRANPIESPDTVAFRADTEEGVKVFLAASHCVDRSVDPLIIIEGDNAEVRWEYEGKTTVKWANGSEECLEPPKGEPRVVEDVIDVLTGRKNGPYCPIEITVPQTLIICGTFESSPVVELPEELRSVQPDTGVTVARGMTEAVLEAFDSAALFSELGRPWARAGKSVSLVDYDYFPRVSHQEGNRMHPG